MQQQQGNAERRRHDAKQQQPEHEEITQFPGTPFRMPDQLPDDNFIHAHGGYNRKDAGQGNGIIKYAEIIGTKLSGHINADGERRKYPGGAGGHHPAGI